jgi:indolepyruvate ferredoxin oxidoreductase
MTNLAAPLPDYDLEDRYRAGGAPALLTGVQAIARLMVEQHERDRRAGLRTASFVSGYQGSPLGGVDRMLAGMPQVLDEHDIKFVPGLNEELAATSVWGSQTSLPSGASLYDGVIGYWYGKGPGVDRATDVLRHANIYGVSPQGGALLLVGDDPASKSSTVPAVSERSLAALNIPVLFPRNASEIVTLGLHGIAMSRASGCIVALKIVADVADGSWIVDNSVAELSSLVPTIEWEGKPYVYRQHPIVVSPDKIIGAEADLVGPRLTLVQQYAASNPVNVLDIHPPDARLGIVAAGTTYDAVRQALLDLGITEDRLRSEGVRLLRLGLIHPVEPTLIKEFASGLDDLIVVEDKTAFIETQVRGILYGVAGAPHVLGKTDRTGNPLIAQEGELTAGRLLAPLRHVLKGRIEVVPPRPTRIDLPLLTTTRAPYFCSGCPHNRSTALPDGSLGGGGIGCHIMVTTSGRADSAVTGVTQMGGEGAQWIGQAAFTDVGHVFQNVGDGTFFHSGQLAVQACVAARVNITYKLLYNEVVAMTGAQDAEGALTVEQLTHKLTSEGVSRIIICAEEPKRHRRNRLAKGTLLWHRDRLDEAQRLLRDVPGVTVLIYDQHCAADARRQRKRGTLPARSTRVVINPAVCEGCGDCGVKSNCLSVQPLETEYGRKTKIDQASCNSDYTCLDGDCPSFVTVETDPTRKRAKRGFPQPPSLEDPVTARTEATQDIFLAGIGGTGILTVNQVLATAALRAGLDVEALDQTGLSQKAGPVTGHLRFAPQGKLEPSNRLTPGAADCILAFDLLTAVTEKNLAYGNPDSTVGIASTSQTPTGDMVYDIATTYPETSELLDRLEVATRDTHAFDALAAAQRIFGDTTPANFLVVGAAYQSGALRIPAAAIEEAIGINGVAVAANVAAFRWGRAAIAAPAAFAAVTVAAAQDAPRTVRVSALETTTLEGETLRLVGLRAQDLVGYQGIVLAERYVAQVQKIWDAERTVTTDTRLSEAVARYLFKLMAYKDEYEVARLLTDPAFRASLEAEVPGAERLTFKLHPPALRAMGRDKKIGFAPKSHFALKALARMKFLRGTSLDLFGYAHVRRAERELVRHFEAMIAVMVSELSNENYDRWVLISSLPDGIRGYEGIKMSNVATYQRRLQELGADPLHL